MKSGRVRPSALTDTRRGSSPLAELRPRLTIQGGRPGVVVCTFVNHRRIRARPSPSPSPSVSGPAGGSETRAGLGGMPVVARRPQARGGTLQRRGERPAAPAGRVELCTEFVERPLVVARLENSRGVRSVGHGTQFGSPHWTGEGAGQSTYNSCETSGACACRGQDSDGDDPPEARGPRGKRRQSSPPAAVARSGRVVGRFDAGRPFRMEFGVRRRQGRAGRRLTQFEHMGI